MAFKTNESQQINLNDSFMVVNDRTKKFVLNSWAKGFSEIVSPAINEERFAILYSDCKASRPNTPVNAVIGSLILKEMFTLTDDELLADSEKDFIYMKLRLAAIFFKKKWKLWLTFLSNI